ncbi:uncharacterized protein LOC123904983 [Trifolium pratense]|uniref:uncharacterized protein LOC123904983 n=1 Tax=Trifolium pratense TaxID=57577 RepID=UPI001E691B72|nr:uncharacterized protein LOC123904983 [Trifolium pratense]
MVIVKSDNGSYLRKNTLVLGCSRGGAYKEPKRKLKKEDTTTRKLNCPFRLRVLDSTYKTNKYKMPLFEIVGVTSTEESYNVGFAYIANEKEDYFTWALETCQSLLNSKDTMSKSTSEDSYIDAVLEFRKAFDQYPDFLKYVETTVLDPVKEKIVSLWIDRVMHIGNTTTNRVASKHGSLKEYLPDRKSDLVKAWEAMNEMVSNQLNKIKTSFGQSTTTVEHYFKDHFLYTKLVYNISRLIKKLPIRLDEINTHWKRLEIKEADADEVDCLKEFNVIQERLKSSNHAMKLQIRDELRKIAFPEITSLTAPDKQLDTKGAKKRPKSSKCNNSTTRFPSYWEHIDARYPDSQASQSKPSKPKKKTARIGTSSPNAIPRRSIPFIEY